MRRFVTFALVLVALGAVVAPAIAAEDAAPKRVLIILAKGFNKAEFWTPWQVLRGAGVEVDVAGVKRGRVPLRGDKKPHDMDAEANLSLDEVDTSDYHALVIPGGYSPGNLETFPRSLQICREFMEADKPVAAICHGSRLLIRAGLMEGRVGTGLYKIADELPDLWRERAFGSYIDREVVIDRNLVTSRYPGDLVPFMRATLEKLGSPLVAGDTVARVLVVPEGIEGHNRWVLMELPKVFGIETKVLRGRDMEKLVESEDFDAGDWDMLVLAGPKAAGLAGDKGLAKLIEDLGDAPVLASGEGAEKAMAGAGAKGDRAVAVGGEFDTLFESLVARGREVASHVKLDMSAPKPVAAIHVEPGFDEHLLPAVRTHLAWRGYDVRIARNRKQLAWVRGEGGVPVWAWPGAGPGKPAIAVDLRGDKAKLTMGEGAIPVPLLDDTMNHATGRETHDAYTFAIALRRGFDDRVVAALKAIGPALGERVVLVGHEKGELKGLNGLIVKIDATYSDPPALTDDATVLLPGGLWPEKAKARQAEQPDWIEEQAARDAKRMAWVMKHYTGGGHVTAVGLDALRLGRGREAFKGKKFACTPQAMWSFGKGGAGFARGKEAVYATPRLLTIRGYEALPMALRMEPPAE